MPRVTQEQIAEATGLSQATVSTILSGSRSAQLSDATRRRVLETASRLGYRRMPGRQPGTRNIGLLVTAAAEQALRQEYYSAIYRGLEEAFWENDYHLVFSSLRDRLHEADAAPKLVRDGLVTGAVVLSAAQSIPALAEMELPLVWAGVSVSQPGVDSVCPDNAAAGQLAAEHLLSLGHRRFLVVTSGANDLNLTERAECFARTIRAGGGRIVDVLEVEGEPQELNVAARLQEYLRQPESRFTAIAAMTDRRASGALIALRSAGIAVPEAMSVIGFLGLATAVQQQPPLTSVHIPAEDIGRIAAYRLLERLKRPEQLCGLKIMVPVDLVVRHSTAPPPAG
jgi:LacI family transcriptional regulator